MSFDRRQDRCHVWTRGRQEKARGGSSARGSPRQSIYITVLHKFFCVENDGFLFKIKIISAHSLRNSDFLLIWKKKTWSLISVSDGTAKNRQPLTARGNVDLCSHIGSIFENYITIWHSQTTCDKIFTSAGYPRKKQGDAQKYSLKHCLKYRAFPAHWNI